MKIFPFPLRRRNKFIIHQKWETLNHQLNTQKKGSRMMHNLKNRKEYNLKWVTSKTIKSRELNCGPISHSRTRNLQKFRTLEIVVAATIALWTSRSSQSIWNRMIQAALWWQKIDKKEELSKIIILISIHSINKNVNQAAIHDKTIKITWSTNHTYKQVDIGKSWNFL
jgi:hypothetical protein